MKIYVDTPLPYDLKQKVVHATPGDQVFFKEDLPDDQARLATLLNADILFGNPRPVEWMHKASNLKWIQLYSTGFEYYQDVNIPAIVTNMQDYYSQPCAETIIAGILSLYRGIDKLSILKEKHQWVGHSIRKELNTLYRKRVVILGKGRIGKQLDRCLRGFECDVKFYGRSASGADIQTTEELRALLPQTDILIGCLPGTEDTCRLITDDLIDSLSMDCIFCNVGRGNLIADENKLIKALKNYQIRGAVLDVTDKEPIPEGHPLWDCPNTILTQHSGGGSSTEHSGILAFFLENYKLFKENKPLQNIVDLKRGY
jgi:glyoxylate/hydroxypyruvate reductase